MDTDLMEVLHDLDKEYGFPDLEDGTYFVTFNLEGCKDVVDREGNTSYMLSWRTDNNQSINDFWRWFRPDSKAQQGARGAVTGALKGISLSTDGSQGAALARGVGALRNSTTEEDAITAFETIAQALEGLRIPIILRTGKAGFQNVVYHDRGKAIEADDPLVLDTIPA